MGRRVARARANPLRPMGRQSRYRVSRGHMAERLSEPKAAAALVAAKPSTRSPRRSDKLDFGGLEDNLGYHIRIAYGAIPRHFANAMGRFDLTQKQLGVLWLIGANGGAAQIAIAKALGMDRASMMAIIDRLQARDLVKRERAQHDGRRQALYLTPKGRRTLTLAKDVLAKHEHWMTARFTPEELAALTDAMKRIHR